MATFTVFDAARKPLRAPGAPRYSDVCFSSRRRHPASAEDPHDTFRDARAFHASRFDWVYSTDPSYICECRSRGYWFGGALNTILTDKPGTATRERGRVLDKNGERIAAPWMVSWQGYWGCVNSPDYRETFLTHARLLIDGGADAIQMDDPVLNAGAVQWGGCHCPCCRKKAAKEGVDLNLHMKDFQTRSVQEFYDAVRPEIDRYAGRRMPWSSNNYSGWTGFPYDLFDFGIAELPENGGTPENLHRQFTEAARRGRQQIFTFVGTEVLLTRRVIATAYASGGHIIVPYDVYNGSHPRIFGKPEEYADLYGFVRGSARFLDGYEDAATFGPGLQDVRYGTLPPVRAEVENVCAFVRARPGEPNAPVVVHLVDWREQPQAFSLILNKSAFSRGALLNAKLIVPPTYDRHAHDQAEETGNYAPLASAQPVRADANGDELTIRIPPLNPAGLLVLVPE